MKSSCTPPAQGVDTTAQPPAQPSGELNYAVSPRMTRLIRSICHHPDLDLRLWAGMTVVINLDMVGGNEDAEAVAIDVVGLCLAGGDYADHLHGEFDLVMNEDGSVADVHYDDAYGADVRAQALLAMMKVPDLQARQLALIELATAAGQTEADLSEITARALLLVAGWISNENVTRH